jgi:Na+/proline symporter
VAASFFFFVTRLLGSGVRLMAACLAVSVLLGWNILPVILIFVGVGIVYMGWGGIRAVVWTNVLQAVVFIGGGIAAIVFLAGRVDGGLAGLFSVAHQGGRLAVFDGGPPAGSPGFLADLFSKPQHFLGGGAQRVFWVHGRVRYRPGFDATVAHRGNPSGKPADFAGHAGDQFGRVVDLS